MMHSVIFINMLHILILEKNTYAGFLDIIDSIVNIVVGIITIIGGVLGIFLLKSLREKNLNATLGYLSRLKVHIHSLKSTFDTYYTDILYRFVPENFREERDHTKSSFINDIISNFSNEASETLYFLKNENNQMPADNTWLLKYDLLLEFLEDMKQIKYSKYFKYDSCENFEEISKEYYEKHSINLLKMLDSIETHQKKIQDILYKRHNHTK